MFVFVKFDYCTSQIADNRGSDQSGCADWSTPFSLASNSQVLVEVYVIRCCSTGQKPAQDSCTIIFINICSGSMLNSMKESSNCDILML